MMLASGNLARRRMLNSVSSHPSGRLPEKFRPIEESKSPTVVKTEARKDMFAPTGLRIADRAMGKPL
jgi:hypothetical protein